MCRPKRCLARTQLFWRLEENIGSDESLKSLLEWRISLYNQMGIGMWTNKFKVLSPLFSDYKWNNNHVVGMVRELALDLAVGTFR